MMYQSFEDCSTELDGVLAIDYFLAQQMCREYGQDSNKLFFHLVLALHDFLRKGNSCMPLQVVANKTRFYIEDDAKSAVEAGVRRGYHFDNLAQLTAAVKCVVEKSGEGPLVFENGALFLRRYRCYENEIAEVLKGRMTFSPLSSEQIELLKPVLAKSYETPATGQATAAGKEINWSKVAVANALGRLFSIITGGPGTGKTYTATRLLLAFQIIHHGKLQIKMAAPTGKAAQRLNESIAQGKAELAALGIEPEQIAMIPDSAKTLHRLLGFRPQALQPKYGADKPLSCDILLVDEVSMIDLPMMTRLLRAITPETILILLGDSNQLPSVEVGNILADLTAMKCEDNSTRVSTQIQQLTGEVAIVEDQYKNTHVTALKKSWRFGGEIGDLAKLVLGGNSQDSWKLLFARQLENAASDKDENRQLALVNNKGFSEWLKKATNYYYASICQAETLQAAFDALAKFRILSPTRVGSRGVDALNKLVEQVLNGRVRGIRPGQHYKGRPVMVTQNDYNIRLFNGDVGLIWPNSSGRMAAYFEEGKDKEGNRIWREVNLARLPPIETVYAMTIHKTQGSEFGHVAIILPEQDSEFLDRQLLYTGITRARDKVSVVGTASVWAQAVLRQTERFSGLSGRF